MNVCNNTTVSLYCFLFSAFQTFIVSAVTFTVTFITFVSSHWFLIALINCLLVHSIVASIYTRRGYVYRVAWRASLLGQGFAFGLLVIFYANNSWKVFGLYFSVLCFFHFSEYFTVSIVNPKTLSLNSFLLNHSREYAAAAVISWTEFVVERYLFPSSKQLWFFSSIGLLLCIFGETIRKAAMITANTNFNHVVQSQREEGHVLVTHGIYAKFRHPSYVGWFLWSIGTQIILINPVCIIGYTITSWLFFKSRIRSEEISLLNFFGEDYVAYQRRVNTGIPFVAGYRIEP